MQGKNSPKSFSLIPIGILHTPFKNKDQCPFQGSKEGAIGEIHLKKRFVAGLKDLGRVSHIFLLTFLDQANRDRLQTVTPYGPEIRGVFATRSPHRPNPIGLSVVELIKIKGHRIFVRGVDCIDGTPVIDIKPYNSEIDAYPQAAIPWYEKSEKNRLKVVTKKKIQKF